MRGPVVRTGEMEGLWVASSHLQAWEVGSRNAYAELNFRYQFAVIALGVSRKSR